MIAGHPCYHGQAETLDRTQAYSSHAVNNAQQVCKCAYLFGYRFNQLQAVDVGDAQPAIHASHEGLQLRADTAVVDPHRCLAVVQLQHSSESLACTFFSLL